jgi:drug/metabolite transporter (DMT)-like permease
VPLGELAGLASAAAWAVNSTLLRWLAPRADVVVLNALRCAIATVLLGGAVVLLGRADQLDDVPLPAAALLLATVVIGIGLGDSLYFHALRLVGVARAQPIAMSYPLFTTLLAMALLGERLSAGALVGVGLVVVGVALVATAQVGARGGGKGIAAQSRQQLRLGAALAIGAALCWAVGTVLLRPALEGVDLWVATTIRMLGAALLLHVYAARHLPAVRRVARDSRAFALGVLLLGVGTAISLSLFLVSVAYAGAARASALSSASPLFGVPLAVMLLRERVTWQLLVGAGTTLAGVWLIVWQ